MARNNSGEINKWLDRIRLSIKEREHKQPDWDLIYRYFRGTQWADYQTKAGDIVIVNLVYSHIKVVVPTVYSRIPKIFITPQRPDTVEIGRINEMIMNQAMNRMKLRLTNKRVIQDIVMYGTGFTKTFYDVEQSSKPQDVDEQGGALGVRFRNISSPVVGGKFTVPKNKADALRINPRDLAFAVGAHDIGDPGFIAHRILKRVGQVKKDKYYKNTKNLQPNFGLNREFVKLTGNYWDSADDTEFGLIEMWEIWNIEKGEKFIIADGIGDYLVAPEEHDYPVEHPFDKIVFTPLEDQMWGEGEIIPWINNQDELNLLRTMQSQHVKRFNRKYAVLDGAIVDESDLLDLARGEDGTIVKVRGVARADAAVASIQDAPMPADYYRYNQLVEGDINRIGKINSLRRGDTQGVDTATEANILEANAQVADIDRISAVGELYLNQMEKVRLYMREFTPGVNIVQMTGRIDDGSRWEAWRREDIDISSEMRVEFGSGLPVGEQQRRNDALILYQQALANPTANPQAALSELLKAYGVVDQTAWFLPPEIIRIQMMQKLMGAQKDQQGGMPIGAGGGIGSQGQITSGEPGPAQTTETAAELRGRAVPAGA